MLIVRNLRRGKREKITLLLNGKHRHIWTERMQTGGMSRTEKEARDWLNAKMAEYVTNGYVETPNSRAREEYIVGRGNRRRFWVLAPEADKLERWTFWGIVGNWNFTKQRRRKFATAEDLERSCELLRARRLKMGFRLVDRATNHC
jgi:hypothetical protein